MATRARPIVQATPVQPEIDVFALPVHPWAAMFPMRSDEDLDAMAESIKANGLRYPVVLGMAVTAEGFPAHLCVIDGRNRIAACKRAGVTPEYRMLNGEDQDAFIADANLERRDLTKGQKAMLLAVRFPEPPKGGRGRKETLIDTTTVSASRVTYARAVLKFCPEMVPLVIDGSMGLDEAYREANRLRVANLTESERRENEARQHDARFKAISERYPDIAELVKDEKLTLDAAEREAEIRDEGIEQEIATTVRSIDDVQFHMTYWSKAGKEVLLRVHQSAAARFRTPDLRATISQWIKVLSAIQEEIK